MGHGLVELGDAVETALVVDVTDALGDAGGLDEVGLADGAVLVGMLAEGVAEGFASDEVQPQSSRAADIARPAIADLRTLDRVITLPSPR